MADETSSLEKFFKEGWKIEEDRSRNAFYNIKRIISPSKTFYSPLIFFKELDYINKVWDEECEKAHKFSHEIVRYINRPQGNMSKLVEIGKKD